MSTRFNAAGWLPRQTMVEHWLTRVEPLLTRVLPLPP